MGNRVCCRQCPHQARRQVHCGGCCQSSRGGQDSGEDRCQGQSCRRRSISKRCSRSYYEWCRCSKVSRKRNQDPRKEQDRRQGQSRRRRYCSSERWGRSCYGCGCCKVSRERSYQGQDPRKGKEVAYEEGGDAKRVAGEGCKGKCV